MNDRLSRTWAGTLLAVVVAATLVGCDQGPAERTGEKLDRALDRLSGKGPAEKAGERLDKAVDELKK